MDLQTSYSVFCGERLIGAGKLREMLHASKAFLERDNQANLLIFEDQTGRQVDFDFSGSLAEVLARAEPAAERVGPGRPKLGVVSREVSLLPRHWEWLEEQPHGISAALRRLVDEAKKKNPGEQRARLGREAVSKFMTAMAGNFEHYEEATRALFAKDNARFAQLIQDWPKDVRGHVLRMLVEFSKPDPAERA
ncbi:MAG TPA: DUF2239 family protein [Polyangiaceae bacterium]